MTAFDDFVAKYNGQPVEAEDPSALDQCMDLAFKWCDALGIDRATIRHQFAYQVWTQPLDITLQFFDYIPNTPNGVPKQGDLVIFNQSVGSAGHISIATGSGDANNFTSFDQNWSGVQYARMVNHVYTSVYGWLHKKDTEITDPVILNQSDAFIAICTKLNVPANKDLALAEVDKLITIEDQAVQKDKQIADANNQITGLSKQLEELSSQLQGVKDENSQLSDNVNQQGKTIQTYEDQIVKLNGEVKNLQSQLNVPVFTGWKLWLYKLLARG